MIVKQFYLGCLAHASYIVIDERTRTAAVIDPQRDVAQYLDEADRHGATIQYVLLTHFHADFVAGHLELRKQTGARIYLGERAEPEYEFTPLKDGDALEFGDVRLSILETPGHTPEGISIVLYDLPVSDREPYAVFTGDTLFVGDVGRPDLLASIGFTAPELASMLYDSLHGKLMKLPDATIVYPAHGAGSMCGKNLGKETHTTIGDQRRFNYALQPMDRQAFVDTVSAEQPEAPAYFLHDAVLNRQERETLEDNLEKVLNPLSPDEVVALRDSGAHVVDVRDAADFAGAHLAGSVNVGLDGKFATWAGTVLSADSRIVIVAEPDREYEAAMRLGRIGLDGVVGFLEGGPGALDGRPELLATLERTTATELAARLGRDDAPFVLDVRTPNEWSDGHVEGAVNVPLNHLEERLSEVPRDREVVVMCRSGYRSSLAASQLGRAGHERLVDLVGGFEAWKASQLPVATPVA